MGGGSRLGMRNENLPEMEGEDQSTQTERDEIETLQPGRVLNISQSIGETRPTETQGLCQVPLHGSRDCRLLFFLTGL